MMYNRAALHEFLWTQRNRLDCVRIHQGELAEMMKISLRTVASMMKEMQQSGRIRKVKAEEGNIGIYSIRDPQKFASP